MKNKAVKLGIDTQMIDVVKSFYSGICLLLLNEALVVPTKTPAPLSPAAAESFEMRGYTEAGRQYTENGNIMTLCKERRTKNLLRLLRKRQTAQIQNVRPFRSAIVRRDGCRQGALSAS
jgi:hypothetical protein